MKVLQREKAVGKRTATTAQKLCFVKTSDDFLHNDLMSPARMWEAADIGFFRAAIELGLLDKEVELDAHSKPIRTKTLGSGYFIGNGWRSAG
ncbi:hypothetical protein [Pseudomonas sp. CP4]|uniref:hypothetical protein n=1 Tax=Pseudomonas sp. CP4 TaxID=3388844 RepID=UPI0039F0A127